MAETGRPARPTAAILVALGATLLVATAAVFGSPFYDPRDLFGGSWDRFRGFYHFRNAVLQSFDFYWPTMTAAASTLVLSVAWPGRWRVAKDKPVAKQALLWWSWMIVFWGLNGAARMVLHLYHGPFEGPAAGDRPWVLARGHYLTLLFLVLLAGASWALGRARGFPMSGVEPLLVRLGLVGALVTADWLFFLILFWHQLQPRVVPPW